MEKKSKQIKKKLLDLEDGSQRDNLHFDNITGQEDKYWSNTTENLKYFLNEQSVIQRIKMKEVQRIIKRNESIP